MFLTLLQARRSVLSVLLSRALVQMHRDVRQRPFQTETSGFLTDLSASSQTVRLLMFTSSSLLQASQRTSVDARRRTSLHSSQTREHLDSHSEQKRRRWVSADHLHTSLSSRMHVFQRMHYLEKREEVSQSLCIHLMVDVSESLLRHLVLQRAHQRELSSTQRKENSSAVQSHSSRIHSSSLQIWLHVSMQLSILYTQQL